MSQSKVAQQTSQRPYITGPYIIEHYILNSMLGPYIIGPYITGLYIRHRALWAPSACSQTLSAAGAFEG